MLAFRPIGERKLESEQSIDKALLGRGVTARGRVFSFFPYLSRQCVVSFTSVILMLDRCLICKL